MTDQQGLLDRLRLRLRTIAEEHGLLDEAVTVTGRTLSVEEAIGSPKRQDFPLMKGKERLVQAVFRDSAGQAFTDQPGSFSGTLSEILDMPLATHFEIAVFVATMNAVLCSLGIAEKTIHCRDEEPEECAAGVVDYLRTRYGSPRVALVGFQPSFLERLATAFDVRVLDLDPDRVGTVQFGVTVEDGDLARDEVLAWADVVMATGSTLANDSMGNFVGLGKPTFFYGTTVAGAACLLGLERYCACGR